MATSSIFQTVCIRNRRKVERFVRALEHSKFHPVKEVRYSRPVSQMTDPSEIKKLFEEPNDGLSDHNA